MNYAFLLLIPLALGFFVGLWCLIVKGLSRAGWQRLATPFEVPALPPGPRMAVPVASVGGVRYRGAVTASVSPQGLSLATISIFRLGHAPLLIPWAALGPFKPETLLWQQAYATTVHTPTGDSISLVLASPPLLEAARPWVQLA